MTSITYVGMDVHTTNFTLCCYSIEDDQVFAEVTVEPKTDNILKYLERVRKEKSGETRFLCGYEAGCLGYSLYLELKHHGIECVILAPSTMGAMEGQKNKQRKNDRRDARNISKCLAFHTYSPVYVPTEMDDAVKEYLRMRDDIKDDLKKTKQQIIAFCTRHGKSYEGKSYWTNRHLDWLRHLEWNHPILKETLDEYLVVYFQLQEKVDMYDLRIVEICQLPQYKERVDKLICFKGIAELTALALLVEIGDFQRFRHAHQFASYLGLVPGEHSSGTSKSLTDITKAGNSHIRRLLVESAQGFGRGSCTSRKSKALQLRQQGQTPAVIAYADKCNERLQRKFSKVLFRSCHNVAKTAAAREMACFIWGMMTDNIS